eukprot:1143901-Pelagomonas_calceolata.AAC.2
MLLNQLEVSKQQHRKICHRLPRASAQATLHTILLGVGGVTYTLHALEPLEGLGLGTRKASNFALKLRAYFVQYVTKAKSTQARSMELASCVH